MIDDTYIDVTSEHPAVRSSLLLRLMDSTAFNADTDLFNY